MVIKGQLITCKRETKNFRGKELKEKLYVTLADVELSADQKKALEAAYKDNGAKMTPAWIKKFEGYVNLSTEFDIPYMDINGGKHNSIDADTLNGLKWHGALVQMSLNVKDGAVYPVSIKFLTEGKEINPFAEFENDEED